MQSALFGLVFSCQERKSLQRCRIIYPSRHEAIAKEFFVYLVATVAHGVLAGGNAEQYLIAQIGDPLSLVLQSERFCKADARKEVLQINKEAALRRPYSFSLEGDLASRPNKTDGSDSAKIFLAKSMTSRARNNCI
jgi:hypothetical protein